MLKLIDIKKVYRLPGQTIKAVDGISLEFRRNEFVSILGPSGCGKTTMLNIIGGLDQYTSGDLVIEGVSTKNYKDANWDNYRNKRIGFVFQSYNLIPHLTILGNVEMALTISGISLSERKERAKKALENVGLGEQINKKPNQLSGGQMQRVAIARALVNEPEILLADEPTGALDTGTSEQIMQLIREIAKNKLVIMVTHNPELAEMYSTRIVKIIDGKVTQDSNPYDSLTEADNSKAEIQEVAEATPPKGKKTKGKDAQKTSMSFMTALSLSWRNLLTKKKRSIMTSIASAIGILGIALILALSSGLNGYIDDITRGQVESSPVTISSGSYTPQGTVVTAQNLAEYPDIQKMFVEKTLNLDRRNVPVPSNLKELFEDKDGEYYLDPSWYNDILYEDGMEVNLYFESADGAYKKIDSGASNPMLALMGLGAPVQQMLKPEFIEKQYDILNTNGKLPTTEHEIVLVVDEFNAITDTTLMSLGLWNIGDSQTEYSFDELADLSFKIASNNVLYTAKPDGYFTEKAGETEIDFTDSDNVLTVKISAVLRLKKSVESGVLGTGIAYPIQVVNWLKAKNMDSAIVEWMNESGNELKSPYNGSQYKETTSGGMGGMMGGGTLLTAEEVRDEEFRKLGGATFANSISVYAKNLSSKDSIKAVFDAYNKGKTEDKQLYFIDIVELIGSIMSTMVNVISYVLIAFTSISLIVSAVMISIITSISVMERTKEIGILRAIGARKKDVTRLFNAENVILGLFAGAIGIAVALLLSVPINMIIGALAGIGSIVTFMWWHILILLGVSTGVAFLSGFLPARKAATKDPVLALRTE